MGGGCYEPVLVALPERDRIGQLAPDGRRARGAVRAPADRGAWLAERVWEPDLPTSLAAAGYDWTILDDAHFRAAAIPEEDLWGPYTTEDQGRLLTGLRHGAGPALPDPVPRRSTTSSTTCSDHATEDGDRVGMMGDDGEKFGAWPTTWEHCWGERPLGRAVLRGARGERRLADDRRRRRTGSTGHRARSAGSTCRPGSYAEMGEWALPPDEAQSFAEVLHARAGRASAGGCAGCAARRGATSRSSTARSTTSTSRCSGRRTRSRRCRPGRPRRRARPPPSRASRTTATGTACSAAIYISHMRLATHEHLIAAEDLADTAARPASRDRAARSRPGRPPTTCAWPAPARSSRSAWPEAAGIGGWDVRAVRHAAAAMRRRPEAYHDTLRAHEEHRGRLDRDPARAGARPRRRQTATLGRRR